MGGRARKRQLFEQLQSPAVGITQLMISGWGGCALKLCQSHGFCINKHCFGPHSCWNHLAEIMDPDTLWHIRTGKRALHATSKGVKSFFSFSFYSLKVWRAQQWHIYSSVVQHFLWSHNKRMIFFSIFYIWQKNKKLIFLYKNMQQAGDIAYSCNYII